MQPTKNSHTKIIKDIYDALKEGDVPKMFDHLTDNCEWNSMGAPVIPQGGKYIGKDEIARFYFNTNAHFEIVDFNTVNINEINPDEVLAIVELEVRSKATGKKTSFRCIDNFKFNDQDKVVHFQDYIDVEKVAKILK